MQTESFMMAHFPPINSAIFGQWFYRVLDPLGMPPFCPISASVHVLPDMHARQRGRGSFCWLLEAHLPLTSETALIPLPFWSDTAIDQKSRIWVYVTTSFKWYNQTTLKSSWKRCSITNESCTFAWILKQEKANKDCCWNLIIRMIQYFGLINVLTKDKLRSSVVQNTVITTYIGSTLKLTYHSL